MEHPEVYYQDYQVIHADSKDEAVEKYNKLNCCSYFYGCVVSILD